MSRYKTTRVNGKSVKLHDLIWEQAHGEKIPEGYHVHHIDGNGNNNDPSNLVLMSRSEHMKLHAALRKQGTDVVNPEDPDVIRTRERCKRWNAANKDYIQAYDAVYYRLNKDRISKRSKAYHEANKEAIAAQRSKHYLENRETILARSAEYRRTHSDQKKKTDSEYRRTHKDQIREYKMKRRGLLNAQRKLWGAKKNGASAEIIAKLEDAVAKERELLKERGIC